MPSKEAEGLNPATKPLSHPLAALPLLIPSALLTLPLQPLILPRTCSNYLHPPPSEHTKVDEWRSHLAHQQARLDKAMTRMAESHADNPDNYTRHRTTYSQVGEWALDKHRQHLCVCVCVGGVSR
jgi:hypothetical protein